MNNLQLGLKAHQAGQLDVAKKHYQQHLTVAHNDPDALQLLGLVYSELGDLDNAIAKLQQSLLVNASQPHVYNNLGICLKKKGLLEEAKKSFEQAIAHKNVQQKDYVDPHKNLIRLLLDAGDYPGAKSSLERASSWFPKNIAIAKLKADYHLSIEDYAVAASLNSTLLKSSPDSVPIRHSLALSLRMSGQSARALDLYNELEQAGVERFQLFHNKANALSDLGQLQEAIAYYRKALKINPAYVESHVNLNELLWELGDSEAFLSSYKDAFEHADGHLELYFSYASTLLRLSQYQSAIEFLEHLPNDLHSHYQYFDLLAQAHKGLEGESEAINAHARAHEFANVSAKASINFAETLLQAGQYDRAEEIIQRALEFEPENKHAWALLGLVWQKNEDLREAILNDYDNLVHEYMIEAPDGFDSVEQFCDELNGYLETLHTGNTQPLEQTLMGGTQTRGNLFYDPNPLIQALVEQFKLCIADYIRKTKPFAGRLPIIQHADSFDFSGSWSVRLHEAGFHTPHVHPMGWLSSAFYVQLPSAVYNDQAKQGWFKLGEPNISLPTQVLAKKHVKPAVGKLVLFQSYMWHGTNTFESDETRMTIAFDVTRS